MQMMVKQNFKSTGPESTKDIGVEIAQLLSFPAVIYLEGDLGAGKTSLCQAIIHAFGYQGAVTSPTYNLIQEYPVSNGVIYHLDLYRLDDPTEIEFLGIKDLIDPGSIFLIEWPSRGGGYLPPASHQINIQKLSSESNLMREIELQSL